MVEMLSHPMFNAMGFSSYPATSNYLPPLPLLPTNRLYMKLLNKQIREKVIQEVWNQASDKFYDAVFKQPKNQNWNLAIHNIRTQTQRPIQLRIEGQIIRPVILQID